MPYLPHKTCCPDPVVSAAAIPDEANCSWLHQSHHCECLRRRPIRWFMQSFCSPFTRCLKSLLLFTRFSSGDILFIKILFLNLSLSLYRVCLSGSFLIRSRYSRMRSLALLPMVWLIYCQATGLDAWASWVKCPARFVSHLHDICIYMSCL